MPTLGVFISVTMLASGVVYFLETHVSWTSIAASCALVCLVSASYAAWSLLHVPYDQGIPAVGIPRGLLGRAKAVYDSIAHGDVPIAEGYRRVSSEPFRGKGLECSPNASMAAQ